MSISIVTQVEKVIHKRWTQFLGKEEGEEEGEGGRGGGGGGGRRRNELAAFTHTLMLLLCIEYSKVEHIITKRFQM